MYFGQINIKERSNLMILRVLVLVDMYFVLKSVDCHTQTNIQRHAIQRHAIQRHAIGQPVYTDRAASSHQKCLSG